MREIHAPCVNFTQGRINRGQRARDGLCAKPGTVFLTAVALTLLSESPSNHDWWEARAAWSRLEVWNNGRV